MIASAASRSSSSHPHPHSSSTPSPTLLRFTVPWREHRHVRLPLLLFPFVCCAFFHGKFIIIRSGNFHPLTVVFVSLELRLRAACLTSTLVRHFPLLSQRFSPVLNSSLASATSLGHHLLSGDEEPGRVRLYHEPVETSSCRSTRSNLTNMGILQIPFL